MIKFYRKWLTLGIMVVASALLGACPYACGLNTQATTPIERLALKLEGKYARNFDRNDYSLHYVSRNPGTIVITVKTLPDTNRQVLGDVINSAKSTVRGVALDSFKMRSLRIEVDMQELTERPR